MPNVRKRENDHGGHGGGWILTEERRKAVAGA
jgi:hypothetical protein